MLSSRIGTFLDLRVADLYAGSGAFGFESLSRGAALACFVEQDPKAIAAIRANIHALGAGERSRVLASSAMALPGEQPFDLIFADPPYAAGSGSAALEAIVDSNWASTGTWISIETARRDCVDPKGLTVDLQRDIGRARITILRR